MFRHLSSGDLSVVLQGTVVPQMCCDYYQQFFGPHKGATAEQHCCDVDKSYR